MWDEHEEHAYRTVDAWPKCSKPLDPPAKPGKLRAPMANRAIWNVRKRHEWLATPRKAKRVKRATKVRCGLQDALERKAGNLPAAEQPAK
jgi:hypothetical protein